MMTTLAFSYQHWLRVTIILVILGLPIYFIIKALKTKDKNNVPSNSIKAHKSASPINKLRLRIDNLSQSDRYIYGTIIAIVLALLCGYLFSDTEYYLSSNEFSNGVRISTAEYDDMAKNNNSDYAMTRLRYNYIIFFSSLAIFLGIGYSLNKKISNKES